MSGGIPTRLGGKKWLLVTAALVLSGVGLFPGTPSILEAWLLAFVILAGLSIGSLGLLMLGHLLGEYWLAPVRPELEAAARTMSLLVILALPLAFHLDALFPWAGVDAQAAVPALRRGYFDPAFFLARNAAYFAIWLVLVFWIARPGEHRHRSALGLAILTPTATLAGMDWVMSRTPEWWSSLFGLVFAISQLLPALAGAVLLTLLRAPPFERRHLRSLERALITLALLILWLWFVQFLIVWMTNLPGEIGWYLARYEAWGWLMPVLILAALVLGTLALLPPILGGRLLRAGTALLLIQHGAHMLWLMNPVGENVTWPAVATVAALAILWLSWMAGALPHRPKPPHGEED